MDGHKGCFKTIVHFSDPEYDEVLRIHLKGQFIKYLSQEIWCLKSKLKLTFWCVEKCSRRTHVYTIKKIYLANFPFKYNLLLYLLCSENHLYYHEHIGQRDELWDNSTCSKRAHASSLSLPIFLSHQKSTTKRHLFFVQQVHWVPIQQKLWG